MAQPRRALDEFRHDGHGKRFLGAGTSTEVSAEAEAQAGSSSGEEAAGSTASRSASKAERARRRSKAGSVPTHSGSGPATPSGALVQSQEPPGVWHHFTLLVHEKSSH